MAYLDKFHTLVGETVMQCQRIEYDVKVIENIGFIRMLNS